MTIFYSTLICALCTFAATISVYAQGSTIIQGRIVDGAGRPIEGVEVNVFDTLPGMPKLIRNYKEFRENTGAIASVTTDKEGRFRAESTLSKDKLRIAIGKQGYVGFTQAVDRALEKDPIVIYRSVSCADVQGLTAINDDLQFRNLLIDLIASDEFESSTFHNRCDVVSELFKINDRVKPLLKSILENRSLVTRAAKLVSYLGDESDRRVLLDLLSARKDFTKSEINEANVYLAGALVSPASSQEWELLTSIITCDKRYIDDGDATDIPFEAAALALSANGSSKALSILSAKSQCERPPASQSAVKLAIRWLKNHPGPTAPSSDLKASVTLAAGIFNYSGMAERFHLDDLIIDLHNERALAFSHVDGGGEYYYYEMVFRKHADTWILSGVWPTAIADL